MISTGTKIKWLKYLLIFFLLCLGIIIGIAIRHYNSIPIAETFNIVDVATLITTIFIAVYVPSILNKNMQIKQEKKDVITSRIDDMQAHYRRINSIVQQRDTSEKESLIILNSLDIISNRWKTILTLIDFLEAKKLFRKELNTISELNKKHQALLTSQNAIPSYPEDLCKKEEELYNEIDRVTSLLLFKLSDA